MAYVKNVIKLSVVRETKEGAFLIYFLSPMELGNIALDPRPCFPPPALTKESTPMCAGEPWPLSGKLCDCGQDI